MMQRYADNGRFTPIPGSRFPRHIIPVHIIIDDFIGRHINISASWNPEFDLVEVVLPVGAHGLPGLGAGIGGRPVETRITDQVAGRVRIRKCGRT